MDEAPIVETTGRMYRNIYVVGDIHGSLGGLSSVLRHAEVIDADLDWNGGRAHVVQCGDVIDRGPASQECLALLLRELCGF